METTRWWVLWRRRESCSARKGTELGPEWETRKRISWMCFVSSAAVVEMAEVVEVIMWEW